jgi:catechol 2,3-dioxygenase-like lactoylglutathione lyase family enzyme
MRHIRSLRQVALMTRDLDASLKFWTSAFGLEEAYRDDLSAFGLRNVVIPLGETFLELLEPADPGSAGARFLERRGEGLYMTIFEGEDADALERALAEHQIAVAFRSRTPTYTSIHLHPKAMSRVLYSFEFPREPGEWPAAGSGWRQQVRTEYVRRIRGVGFITENGDADAGRWHRLFGVAPERYWVQDNIRIANVPVGNDGAFIEFQQPVDPECPAARYLSRNGAGMYYLALEAADLDKTVERARAHGAQLIREDRSDTGRSVWLHPRSMHGVITEILEAR